MSIAGVIAAVVRQEAPYQAEIQMGAQLLLDFQGARNGGRRYYWYRGTRYADWRRVPGLVYSCPSENIGENADGSLVRAAPNELCLTDQGASIWEARTNKVTCWSANPTSLQGMEDVSGGRGTVVNDMDALRVAGLAGVATSGNVYRLDNTGNASSVQLNPVGAVGNANPHTISVWARGSGDIMLRDDQGGQFFTLTANYQRFVITKSPASAGPKMRIQAQPGTVVNFILPQLEEGAFATPPIVTRGAAETRAQPSLTINGQQVLLGQFRGNYIANSTMVGAAVGAPGALPTGWVPSDRGLAVGTVGMGQDADGWPYVDVRISGTVATAGNLDLRINPATSPAATVGHQWYASAVVALVAGAPSPSGASFSVWEATAGGSWLASSGNTLPTTAVPTLVWSAKPFTNVGVQRAIAALQLPGLTVGQVLDVTYRISQPQLGLGLAPGAFIPTSNGAVVLGNAFTVVANVTLGNADGTSRTLVQIDDGGSSNRIGVQRDTGNGASLYLSPASAAFVVLKANVTGVRPLRIVARVGPTTVSGAADGGAIANGVYIPPAFSTLRLGITSTGSSPLNGYLGSVGLFGAVNDNQLPQLMKGAA